MKKLVIIALISIAALGGIAFYSGVFSRTPAQAAGSRGGGPGGGFPGGGFGGGGFGGGVRPPMTVDVVSPTRARVAHQVTVVGNLIGDATVAVVPKTAGRLDAIYVRLGDAVTRGGRIAKIEDREMLEQVKQGEAAFEVGKATIRQREADLKFADTNLERSRNLFGRELLPKQALDDADARQQAAMAQVDLARAQFTQSQSRLDELRMNLANTVIVSPVNGFVARRLADPGAFASPNSPVVDVVDINRVKLVANVVEKDLRRVHQGDPTRVEVDAFPGEVFSGRIARVAPVLDPSTRTAEIEVEIPNPGYRLKPGMYARVGLTIEQKDNALVVPRNALVDVQGQRGVFLTENGETVSFRPVQLGIEETQQVEVVSGIAETDRVITTGAAGLRDGDRILLAGAANAPGGQGAQRGPGPARQGNRPPGAPRRPGA